MKRLLISLTEDEHKALKKEAYESDMSMSELLKGSYFVYNPLGKISKSATELMFSKKKQIGK
jgi:hypothetical protein